MAHHSTVDAVTPAELDEIERRLNVGPDPIFSIEWRRLIAALREAWAETCLTHSFADEPDKPGQYCVACGKVKP